MITSSFEEDKSLYRALERFLSSSTEETIRAYPVYRGAAMSSTYASGSQWVRGVTDTGLIRLFPTGAKHRDTPIRSALTAFGHLTLLTATVGLLTVAGLSSKLGSTHVLASGPVVLGLWVLLGFVGAGIVKTSFRLAGYGLIYLAGQAAAMIAGGYWLDDAVFFGGVYLGLTGVLAFAPAVVRFNIKWNGR